MARNKSPEETIAKIVDVSTKLFLEKGYENTSIQDIVNNLGGLSKGAIYHHFKNKEEILVAVMDKIYEKNDSDWDDLRKLKGDITGLEKILLTFKASLNNPRQDEIFAMAPDFLKNPQMLAMQLESIYKESAPMFIQPMIEQGIKDGSIKTNYPKELAEVILIFTNIWLMPTSHIDGVSGLEGRIGFFRELLEKLDINFVDDEMIERFSKISKLYDRKK